MNSYDAHLIQARHNEDLVQLLDPGSVEFPDWVITVTFYSALHYVEAGFSNNDNILHSHLEKKSREPIHHTRLRLLRSKYSMTAYQSYRNLYDASFISRYLFDPVSKQDIRRGYTYYGAKAVQQFHDVDLASVRKEFGFRDWYQ